MPRPRQRKKRTGTCDCLDCDEQPFFTAPSPAAAAARQEPAPKGLVILTTNISAAALEEECGEYSEDEETWLPHLDSIVREGGSGLLSVDNGVLSGNPIQTAKNSLEHFFGNVGGLNRFPDTTAGTNVQRRFQGMRVMVLTPFHELHSTCVEHGTTPQPLSADYDDPTSAILTAHKCAKLLGFGNEKGSADMVVLHVDGHAAAKDATLLLAWVDTFVRAYDQIGFSKSSTFTLLLLGPLTSPLFREERDLDDLYSFIQRPVQSAWKPKVDPGSFLVSVRRLEGVVRRDAFSRLGEFQRFLHGAYSKAPLERVLSDITYKMGYSSKYGS